MLDAFIKQTMSETAKNIADALGVTIDCLIGGSDTMVLDKDLLQRMEAIQKLNEIDKGHLFALMDAFLQKVKLQQVLQCKKPGGFLPGFFA